MEVTEYKNVYQNEENHFFYKGNHNLVLSLIEFSFKDKKRLKILDAGCGTGLLAKKMETFGDVWGVDFSEEAVKFSKKRGINVKKANVTDLPFKENSFDLVVSVDVIYHKSIKDDKKALEEFYRVLKPEGILILRVPANRWLNLTHDTHVHTRERYSIKQIEGKVKKTGFQIQKISFVNASLLPLAMLRYFWERINPPKHINSGVDHPLPIINSSLSFLLSLENTLLKNINFPFGLGIIVIVRKPFKR